MKAMLLAAGRGERMGDLGAATPKPLLRLGEESLIERQLRALGAAGIRDIVINVSWLGEHVRRALGDGSRYAVNIAWSQEGEPPLETCGGIIHALPLLGSAPFLVVNSDVVTNFDFGRLVQRAPDHEGDPEGLLGTLVLVPNPRHHRDGDYGIDSQGRITMHGPRLTYAGVSLLHPDLFRGHPPGRAPLRPVFDSAVRAGRLAGLRYDGLWIDVGTPERLEYARRRLHTD
jgi:MurNAc alpha-1-phosphate uridylyltransferase